MADGITVDAIDDISDIAVDISLSDEASELAGSAGVAMDAELADDRGSVEEGWIANGVCGVTDVLVVIASEEPATLVAAADMVDNGWIDDDADEESTDDVDAACSLTGVVSVPDEDIISAEEEDMASDPALSVTSGATDELLSEVSIDATMPADDDEPGSTEGADVASVSVDATIDVVGMMGDCRADVVITLADSSMVLVGDDTNIDSLATSDDVDASGREAVAISDAAALEIVDDVIMLDIGSLDAVEDAIISGVDAVELDVGDDVIIPDIGSLDTTEDIIISDIDALDSSDDVIISEKEELGCGDEVIILDSDAVMADILDISEVVTVSDILDIMEVVIISDILNIMEVVIISDILDIMEVVIISDILDIMEVVIISDILDIMEVVIISDDISMNDVEEISNPLIIEESNIDDISRLAVGDVEAEEAASERDIYSY